MEEHGVIVEKKGQTAVIRAQRSSACESCASKKSCHGGATTDNNVLIEADDPVGTKVGDRVAFSVSAGSVLKAGLLLYLLPVAFFIVGVIIGQTVFTGYLPDYNADLVAGATGVVFLAAAFISLKAFGAFSERRGSFRPRVLRVE